jgi:hypothetical protein
MEEIIDRFLKLEKFRTGAKVSSPSLAWPLDTQSTFLLTIVNKLFIIDQ